MDRKERAELAVLCLVQHGDRELLWNIKNLGLSILFCILTFIGTMYYIMNHFETTAGYAGISLLCMLFFSSLHFREKRK